MLQKVRENYHLDCHLECKFFKCSYAFMLMTRAGCMGRRLGYLTSERPHMPMKVCNGSGEQLGLKYFNLNRKYLVKLTTTKKLLPFCESTCNVIISFKYIADVFFVTGIL